jgi:thiol-disulfide isomerase/thioredoxin
MRANGPGIGDQGLRTRVRPAVAVVAALVIITSGSLLVPVRAGAQESGIAVGTKAPGAAVETLDGKAVDLAQYIGTSPVLIEFWATWCPNCKELEEPLERAHAKFGTQVKFLGVAVSFNQSPERIRRYVERHKPPLEMLFDRTGAASGAYKAPATSYIVVIDRAGKVVYTGLGGDQDLEAAIRKAL